MEIFKKKIKTIYQSEASECGLACLTMILNYFGKEYSLSDMRNKYYTALDGASLNDISNIAKKEELIALSYELEEEDLEDIKTPCIGYWQNNHFIIIEKITKNNIHIVDPESGTYIYTRKEFLENFSFIVCEFEKTDNFIKDEIVEKKKTNRFNFINNVKDFKLNIFRIMVMSFCLEFFIMLIPLFNKIVIDGIVIENNKELLFSLGVGFVFIIIFKSLSELIRDHMLLFFTKNLQINFKYILLDKLLKLKISFFEKRGYSNILSRFESLEYIKDKISNGIIENLVGGIAIFITGAFMFYLHNLLLYIVVASLLLIFIIKLMYYKRLENITKIKIENEAKEQAFLTELLKKIETIKINGEEEKIFKKWYNIHLESSKSSKFLDKMYININIIEDFVINIQRLLIIWVGSIYILNEQTTMGLLFSFILYQIIFTEKVVYFINNIFDFRLLILHLNRINEIKEEKEELNREGNTRRFEVKGEIELKNVYFRYNKNEEYLFENLNLKINKKESVVITGKSGTGKTTLLKIMSGLIEIEKGQILIDGIDIRDIGLNNYRKNIGVVTQNESIFSDSIKENITLFEDKFNISMFNKVIEKSSIKEDIEKLKMKEETILGEYGAVLSSGQIQRLMIARALYRNPKILFLDEAMSNLDEKMEKEIVNNLKNENITKISIAHREESKKLADRVINIEDIHNK